MKKILTVILFLTLGSSLKAQDLIVTHEGDSINCKITEIEKDYIYFVYKHEAEIRNTLISVKQVKSIRQDFYQQSDNIPLHSESQIPDYPPLRLGINAGWGYRIARLPDGIAAPYRDYLNGLRAGFNFSVDGLYYFSEVMGIGLKYNMFHSAGSDNVTLTDGSGNTRRGRMEDNIYISFFGPTLSTRLLNKENNSAYISNFSLGYVGYKDNAVLIDPITITGNAVGLAWDLGYETGISESGLFGVQLSYYIGVIKKFEYDYGHTKSTLSLNRGEYESLSRLNLSFGLRFSK